MTEGETQTYWGTKPVGQGSWDGYGTSFPAGDNTPRGGIPIAGPGSDPIAEGRTVQRSEGVAIDWDLLKEVLWEDRYLLSGATLAAVLTYLVVHDPEKYVNVLRALAVGVAETVKGIGEVIPG